MEIVYFISCTSVVNTRLKLISICLTNIISLECATSYHHHSLLLSYDIIVQDFASILYAYCFTSQCLIPIIFVHHSFLYVVPFILALSCLHFLTASFKVLLAKVILSALKNLYLVFIPPNFFFDKKL